MILTEDDIYRASTQYKLWSFTPEALASLRATTNRTASGRVVEAIKRHRKASKRKKTEEGSGKTNGSTRDSNTPQQSTSTPALSDSNNQSASQTPQQDHDSSSDTEDEEVDTLTVPEELKLLSYYSRQLLRLASTAFPRSLPRSVPSTAVIFLRRFYLSNSPMTYHPKSIFPTCLFLASKTENSGMSLNKFVGKMREEPIKSKLTMEDVLAPEFIVTQGLRFTFEVRHPSWGLGAGWMELLAMARGEAGMTVHSEQEQNNDDDNDDDDGGGDGDTNQQKTNPTETAKSLQNSLLSLPPTPSWTDKTGTSHPSNPPARDVASLESRIGLAHDRAKELLSEAALVSDAYFLYSPAQIWLAALWIADEPLARCYLGTKIPSPGAPAETNGDGGAKAGDRHYATRILSAITSCASMLSAQHHGAGAQTPREELVRIDKKLYRCQNPDKRDLVGLNRKVKSGQQDAKEAREHAGGGADDYAPKEGRSPAKKPRLEKGVDADDVFGGPLEKPSAGRVGEEEEEDGERGEKEPP